VSTTPVVSLPEQAPVSRPERWAWPRIAVAGLLVMIYLAGAVVQGFRINLDMHRTDQSAYMDYARSMAATNYAHVGDRARMPVYPFLQSLLYRPGMSDDEFFRRGKAFNIGLSVVLLFLTYVLLSRWLDPLAATAIVLVTAFTVFVFKAGYFQCELLFYFLNLFFFVLCIENLRRSNVFRAALLGLAAGVAYLTKASVLPGIVLFLVCYAWGAMIRRDGEPARRDGSRLRSAGRAAVFVLVFLGVVYPYIRTSKHAFGRYFYNVTSTFYFWYDSWEEAELGTKAHGDRVGWPRMPADQIPSARKYWREHTLSQTASRLSTGLWTVVSVAWSSYGYLKYAFVYVLAGVFFLLHRRRIVARALLSGSAAAACVFVALYFASHLLLYSWYTPVADGNRLTLSLFLPGLSSISYFLSRTAGRSPARYGRFVVSPAVIHGFVIAALCLDLAFGLPHAVTHMSGAD
jgi:hypothetical protein